MKGFPNYLVALALMALACSQLASAFDPAPLQDFCVAVNTSTEAGMYKFFFLAPSCYYYFLLLESFEESGFLLCSICEWKVLQGSKTRQCQ
jgi:hypothetical protein